MGNARLLLALAIAIALPSATTAAASAADDRFLAGVASAVLELEFGLTEVDVVVEDGRLRLDPRQLRGHDPKTVRARLDGLHHLEVSLDDEPGTLHIVTAPEVLPRPAMAPRTEDALVTGFLPEDELFESPLADPRAPAISAAYTSYFDDDEFSGVGRADLGGTVPAYGWDMAGGQWQVGLQAGVFSIFDLDRPSVELINADYLVAAPLQARYGDAVGRLRILHQSSHLGDEYLLRTDTDRMNLAYEAVDFLLGYDFTEWLRLYGGGGSIVRKSPDDLDPLSVQGGFEAKGDEPILSSIVYPVGGVDVQAFEETGWSPNVSVKGGLELHNGFLSGTRVQLLAEYFNGRSPNGQFFERSIDYAGLGLRVLF